MKAPGVLYRQSGATADRDTTYRALDILDQYHGQATGTFSGDECLAGPDPARGTELCAVVEFMYSLGHMVATFGDVALADLLEHVAYNALPATFTPDMWAHQYDQLANQVLWGSNTANMSSMRSRISRSAGCLSERSSLALGGSSSTSSG